MTEPGWSLGITGQRSRRKPLTLAVQFIGKRSAGSFGERAVFSDLNMQVNKPYFVAAAFTPASEGKPGRVVFAVKDLSNDDEPLLIATAEHDIAGGLANSAPLTLGGRSGRDPQSFHGAIDDVRISEGALAPAQLLYTAEGVGASTLGYWRFEQKPDVLADSSGHGRSLERAAARAATSDAPARAALGDFCQALLNASEFLYTE